MGQNFQMLLPFLFWHRCPTIPEKLYGVCVREGSHSRMKRTREEEEQRYREYEDLIDEIADICHIEDKASIDRLTRWKVRRRYILAVKYRCGRKIISSFRQLCRYEKRSIYKILRDFVWISMEDTWIIKRVYSVFRKCVQTIFSIIL